jgi:hypothetical protein
MDLSEYGVSDAMRYAKIMKNSKSFFFIFACVASMILNIIASNIFFCGDIFLLNISIYINLIKAHIVVIMYIIITFLIIGDIIINHINNVNLLFFLINLKICVRYKFISIYLNYL